MKFAERKRLHVNRCRAGQQQHALAEKGIQHSTIECELTGTDCCDKECC